jgi:hypothetical protein
MPELTMASAAARILASSMAQPKVFQLFQPSGGSTAGLPGAAAAGDAGASVTATRAVAARRAIFMGDLLPGESTTLNVQRGVCSAARG